MFLILVFPKARAKRSYNITRLHDMVINLTLPAVIFLLVIELTPFVSEHSTDIGPSEP